MTKTLFATILIFFSRAAVSADPKPMQLHFERTGIGMSQEVFDVMCDAQSHQCEIAASSNGPVEQAALVTEKKVRSWITGFSTSTLEAQGKKAKPVALSCRFSIDGKNGVVELTDEDLQKPKGDSTAKAFFHLESLLRQALKPTP